MDKTLITQISDSTHKKMFQTCNGLFQTKNFKQLPFSFAILFGQF